jgi:phage terminase large subunit GpA-like protein
MSTLAQLQAEREGLRAIQAQNEYRAALAETCARADLLPAAQELYRAIHRAIDTLAQRWEGELAHEHDETRLHYLMSDALQDTLHSLAAAAEEATATLPLLGEQFARGVRPRGLLTVSQWADRHREIKSGSNAPGRWNTALTPYLREIMDSLSEHAPVRQITFMKGSGVGATEVLYNWIGYIMHHLRNKDLLLVVPTLELRDRSFNPRLRKMLNETGALAELVSNASRSKSNRDDLLEYGAQARIIKAGANSPDSLRSEHLPYVIADEIDAFPWDVGGEGDPLTLIENRQRTFSRAKTYLVSTPTVEHESHIAAAYAASDQRLYHVPCPHCGHYHPLEWKHFHYKLHPGADPDDPYAEIHSAWMACPECGAVIHEHHKPAMLCAGRWIPRRPQIRKHRGYHLNVLYAPVNLGQRWIDIAAKWRRAQQDEAQLKGFVNTYLGEVWRETGEGIEDLPLLSRLENLDPATLPIALITAGVDVQADRLEVTVVGFGVGEEAWTLEHIIIAGDTLTDDPWQALEPVLLDAGVAICCIDAGYRPGMVQAFCERRRWCIPTKGVGGPSIPLIQDERRRRQRLRYRRKKGVPVEPVGVDEGKALLYARLKRHPGGEGTIHFINGPSLDDEYFAQLAAEKLVRRQKRGRALYEWVQTRPRNEALDCWILALVACRLSGRNLSAPLPKPESAPTTIPATPTPDPARPRRPTRLIR